MYLKINIFPVWAGGSIFRGIVQFSLSSKGRFAVSVRYRNKLIFSCTRCLIAIANSSKYLLFIPSQAWEPIEQKFNNRLSFNPEIRSLQRLACR